MTPLQELAEVKAQLLRLQTRSGCRQRQCASCGGDKKVLQPGGCIDCPGCDGQGYELVFDDVLAAQLVRRLEKENEDLKRKNENLEARLRELTLGEAYYGPSTS